MPEGLALGWLYWHLSHIKRYSTLLLLRSIHPFVSVTHQFKFRMSRYSIFYWNPSLYPKLIFKSMSHSRNLHISKSPSFPPFFLHDFITLQSRPSLFINLIVRFFFWPNGESCGILKINLNAVGGLVTYVFIK